MLSRIADSLFWMNRYMERADGLLRLTSTHYILGMDKDVNSRVTWKPVLDVVTNMKVQEMTSLEQNTEESLKKIVIDQGNNNSIKSIINRARENARGAQDHITKEVWEEINQIYHLVNGPVIRNKLNTFQALQVMKELTSHLILYSGTIDITMPRGNGWHFMSLGRYVERCLQTIVLTEKHIELMNSKEEVIEDREDVNDVLQWRYVLLALSGYELHLKSYRSFDHNYNVLHQLIINESFPHSIIYSLKRIDLYLERVIKKTEHDEDKSLLRSFGRLYSKVKYMDLSLLKLTEISPFLAEIKADLFKFNIQFGQQFFSYT